MKTFKPNREQGSLRFTIFLFMVMVGAFWYGGQGVYTAIKNRKPVALNYSDLAKGRPTAHWLTIKDCEFDLSEAAFKVTRSKYAPASGGLVTEAYLPLHVAGKTEEGGPCYAVLATKDSGIISIVNEMRAARTDAEFDRIVAKHGPALRQQRDVSGLVRFGIEDSESGKLKGLKRELAPGFIILAEGAQPKLKQSVGLLFVGFVIAGGMVLMWRSNREPSTEDV